VAPFPDTILRFANLVEKYQLAEELEADSLAGLS
jgi:hypothetical protein